jgi:hypothetical protein
VPRTMTEYGQGKAAALRRAVHELLAEHEANDELPTSNRFLFYELRQRGGPLYGHASRCRGALARSEPVRRIDLAAGPGIRAVVVGR